MYKFSFFLFVLFCSFIPKKDFISEQKKFERVRKAFTEKENSISKTLSSQNISINEVEIMLIAYKHEEQLELYAKKKSALAYQKIETYEICSSSGGLGPKRKQGDNQVPEGFYYIDRFNPTSNFYLSLGVSYPNQSDKRKSTASDLGGDIFIHGSCVTIGCMPMTDDKIKEIYLYAISARQNGQVKIPVYIFPFKMTDQNFNAFSTKYKSNSSLIKFWSNLKTGFDKLEAEKRELKYSISGSGDYLF